VTYHDPDPLSETTLTGGAVAVITESAIRELASIKGEGAPITSCYIDVDGRRVAKYLDLQHEVDLLLREAKARANGDQSVHARAHAVVPAQRVAVTDDQDSGWLAHFSGSV
jgi:hypothetical protein